MREKLKKIQKILKWVLAFLGVLILILVSYLYYIHKQIQSGNLVDLGGQWFTLDEIREAIPPQYYEVESKNSPEEVYTAFREALLVNDKEMALSFIREENRAKYQEVFDDGEKWELYKTLPTVDKIIFEEENSYENYANYHYSENGIDNNKNILSIQFRRNENGFWEIEAI